MDISQAGSGDMQALALHAGPDAPDAAVPQAAYSTRPQNDPAPVPSQSVPREGTIRADGAFVPEGRPQDWDLPPPR